MEKSQKKKMEMEIWAQLYQRALAVQGHRVLSPFVEAGGVAAALLTQGGNIYTGVCIDASSSLGMCAERAAIAAMVTAGENHVVKLMALMPDGQVAMPCGACRELLMQLHRDNRGMEVLASYPVLEVCTLAELCPQWWGEGRFAQTSL